MMRKKGRSYSPSDFDAYDGRVAKQKYGWLKWDIMHRRPAFVSFLGADQHGNQYYVIEMEFSDQFQEFDIYDRILLQMKDTITDKVVLRKVFTKEKPAEVMDIIGEIMEHPDQYAR